MCYTFKIAYQHCKAKHKRIVANFRCKNTTSSQTCVKNKNVELTYELKYPSTHCLDCFLALTPTCEEVLRIRAQNPNYEPARRDEAVMRTYKRFETSRLDIKNIPRPAENVLTRAEQDAVYDLEEILLRDFWTRIVCGINPPQEERELMMFLQEVNIRSRIREIVDAVESLDGARLPSCMKLVELSSLKEDERACAICQQEFNAIPKAFYDEVEVAVKLEQCGHVIGDVCLTKWLSGENPSCPFCRKIITPGDLRGYKVAYNSRPEEWDKEKAHWELADDSYPEWLRALCGQLPGQRTKFEDHELEDLEFEYLTRGFTHMAAYMGVEDCMVPWWTEERDLFMTQLNDAMVLRLQGYSPEESANLYGNHISGLEHPHPTRSTRYFGFDNFFTITPESRAKAREVADKLARASKDPNYPGIGEGNPHSYVLEDAWEKSQAALRFLENLDWAHSQITFADTIGKPRCPETDYHVNAWIAWLERRQRQIDLVQKKSQIPFTPVTNRHYSELEMRRQTRNLKMELPEIDLPAASTGSEGVLDESSDLSSWSGFDSSESRRED